MIHGRRISAANFGLFLILVMVFAKLPFSREVSPVSPAICLIVEHCANILGLALDLGELSSP